MAKAAKLYSDSPSLKRGSNGSMGVQKPSEADGENMGVDGDGLQGAGHDMPIHEKLADAHKRHETERKDMHDRHMTEHKDMHKRHGDEVKKLMVGDEKTGEGDIKKVEGTK